MEIIFGILFLFAIDTILGVWASLKYQIFRSNSLQRAVGKFSKYFLAMLNAWILSAVFPMVLGWVFATVGAFIMITEAMSNIEKLALLGFELPGWIISKINKQYENLSKDKELPKKIMDERDCENNN
jgi:phage-related holin